jgi:hypothetical protein
MYDFTSGSLLKVFLADLAGQKTQQMVLDDPAPNETRDQLDWVTVQELRKALTAAPRSPGRWTIKIRSSRRRCLPTPATSR